MGFWCAKDHSHGKVIHFMSTEWVLSSKNGWPGCSPGTGPKLGNYLSKFGNFLEFEGAIFPGCIWTDARAMPSNRLNIGFTQGSMPHQEFKEKKFLIQGQPSIPGNKTSLWH